MNCFLKSQEKRWILTLLLLIKQCPPQKNASVRHRFYFVFLFCFLKNYAKAESVRHRFEIFFIFPLSSHLYRAQSLFSSQNSFHTNGNDGKSHNGKVIANARNDVVLLPYYVQIISFLYLVLSLTINLESNHKSNQIKLFQVNTSILSKNEDLQQ